MKKKIIILVSALVLITIIALSVKGIANKQETEIDILFDITDTQTQPLQTGELAAQFDLTSANKWNGAIFRFGYISDISLTKQQVATLPAANMWLSNEFDRAKAITAFTDSVANIMAEASRYKVGKSKSSVYLSIADALNRLSQSPATTRELIISGDLMENSSTLSFYSKETFEQLKSHPISIASMLTQQEPLSSLKGITIYLIYQPQSPEMDAVYRTVAGFYKQLFESDGAIVFIEPNLTN